MFDSVEQIQELFEQYITNRKKITHQGQCILYNVGANGETNKYTRTSVTTNGRKTYYYVHQLALLYKLKQVKLAEHEESSHLCNTHSCINPEHINNEPHEVNMQRISCRDDGCMGNHTDRYGNPYPNCIEQVKVYMYHAILTNHFIK